MTVLVAREAGAQPSLVRAGGTRSPAERFGNIEVQPDILELLGQLDDGEYAARERATEALITLPGDRKDEIYALLTRDDLSAEQRERLLTVVWERLVSRPRGALGIRMNGEQAADGAMDIVITELLPGLPAREVLREGDRITHIDGQRLTDTRDLLVLVQGKMPGENIMLTIKRRKRIDLAAARKEAAQAALFEVLKIELALGSAELLDQPGRVRAISEVADKRKEEAMKRLAQFALEPSPVVIENVTAEPITESEIGQHPAIARMRHSCRRAADGRLNLTPGLRAQWLTTAGSLRREAERTNVSPRRAELNRRIYERFIELRAQVLQGSDEQNAEPELRE